MYRRRKPVRTRGRCASELPSLGRNIPKFSFYQIREEVRATSEVVISLTRDRDRDRPVVISDRSSTRSAEWTGLSLV